jgi:hypothetical protein
LLRTDRFRESFGAPRSSGPVLGPAHGDRTKPARPASFDALTLVFAGLLRAGIVVKVIVNLKAAVLRFPQPRANEFGRELEGPGNPRVEHRHDAPRDETISQEFCRPAEPAHGEPIGER